MNLRRPPKNFQDFWKFNSVFNSPVKPTTCWSNGHSKIQTLSLFIGSGPNSDRTQALFRPEPARLDRTGPNQPNPSQPAHLAAPPSPCPFFPLRRAPLPCCCSHATAALPRPVPDLLPATHERPSNGSSPARIGGPERPLGPLLAFPVRSPELLTPPPAPPLRCFRSPSPRRLEPP